jgi:hypothetical protein
LLRGIRRFFSSTSAVRTLNGDVAFGLEQVDEQTCRLLVGGTVVHINAGVAGLMCAIMLGKRSETADPELLSS